jgi:chromosome partitioning protein
VRRRRHSDLNVVLVPNRVDARTLEGRQLVNEMVSFAEPVGPSVGSRSSFVRAFSAGLAICDFDSRGLAAGEIARLCDFLVQKQPSSTADAAASCRDPGLEHVGDVGIARAGQGLK